MFATSATCSSVIRGFFPPKPLRLGGQEVHHHATAEPVPDQALVGPDFKRAEARLLLGTLEQVADVANTLASKIWNRWPHSWRDLIEQCEYYQERNEASYESRRRTAEKLDTS